MKIGITGHQRLKDPAGWSWVQQEMDQLIAGLPEPVTGITSLAAGADQLFGNAIIQRAGALQAVIPFADYECTFVSVHDRKEFERLLGHCVTVETLPKLGTDEEAYLAAGKRVIDLSDLVVAVWDGQPAAGLGGTADAFKYGLQQQKRIVHLNPISRIRRDIVGHSR